MCETSIGDKEHEEAALLLRRPPAMYNCAQSVAVACGHDEQCEGLAGYGGGRAPEGLCGALYAALGLVPPERREELKASFGKTVGALRCSDIKGGAKVSCVNCVAAGIALVRAFK